jgi:hypothetical protein
VTEDAMDMIIGDVKEGKPKFHPSIRTPKVIETVLRRFSCCSHDLATTAQAMVHGARAETQLAHGLGCRIRMIVFAGANLDPNSNVNLISLGHVVQFMRQTVPANPDVFLHCQLKDDARGFLVLLEKLALTIG